MKNTILFSITLLFLCLHLSAANNSTGDPTLSWGAKFKLPAKSYELGFIGNQSAGYIDLSHMKGRSLNLQKLTPSSISLLLKKFPPSTLGKNIP